MTSKSNDWSPLSSSDWAAAFISGFLAMFLLFFKFYAGVFAEEIFADRDVEMSWTSALSVSGVLPLSFGMVSLSGIIGGFLLSNKPRARGISLWGAVLVGAVGLVATLWGLYSPVL